MNSPKRCCPRALRSLVLDVGSVGFALWTLAANACAFTGGSLYQTMALFALLGAVLVVALVWQWRRSAERRAERPPSSLCGAFQHFETESYLCGDMQPQQTPRTFRIAVVLAALLVAVAYRATGNALVLWFLSLVLILAGLLTETFCSYRVQPLRPRRTEEAFLWSLGLLAAYITLIAHRPSSDDTFYVNLAVAARDTPGAAILAGDTMVGVAGLELNLPIYKVHSVEVLMGAIALVLNLPALSVAYFVVPTLAALLVPLALGRLFQTMLPRSQALWATAFVVAFYLFEGSAYAGFSNHAFVRLHHGKSIFLTLAVPLLIVYALRLSAAPSWPRFLMLCAAQIGSIGLTSTALWIAPLVAGFSLVCVWRPAAPRSRAVLLGVLASSYIVALALVLRGALAQVLPRNPPPLEPGTGMLSEPALPSTLMEDALSIGLDGFDVQAAIFFVLLAGPALYRPGSLARRFALTYLGLFFLLGMNPFLAPLAKANVTPLYERIVWVLPVPALLALGFSGLFVDRGSPSLRRGSRLLAVASAVCFLTFVPSVHALTRANLTTLKRPAYKVPSDFDIARLVNRLTPERGYVLAPEDVSVWMTTQQGHAYPLATKPKYLRKQPSMPRAEASLRSALVRFVEGRNERGGAAAEDYVEAFRPTFRAALQRFRLATVCFEERSRAAAVIRSELAATGVFKLVGSYRGHEIWTRSLPLGAKVQAP